MGDFETCECRVQSDRDMLLNNFNAQSGGFARFRDRLRRIAAGPVLRDASSRGHLEDLNEISEICRGRNFVMNSSSLKGSLLKTSVHFAAASGHLNALRALLDLQADPNA